MFKASLKSLWARKLRLIMSTFAIVLGVAFVAGSLMFTDTLNKSFKGLMNGTVADVNVRPKSGAQAHGGPASDARSLKPADLERVRKVPGVAQAEGDITSMSAYVLGKDNKVVGSPNAPAIGANYFDAPAADGVDGLKIGKGRAPAKYGEIAIDPQTADRGKYKIGDTVSIMTPGNPPRYEAKLVGIVDYANGSLMGATLSVVDTKTAQRLFLDGRDGYHSLWIVAAKGESQQTLADKVKKDVPSGYEVITGKKASDDAANAIQKAMSFITTFLLVFAGVALLVGSFLIVNTFGMLVAQRSKELALMRALGASARQIQTSVLFEALFVGAIGSIVGLGLGVLLAKGVMALFKSFGADFGISGLVLAPRTVIVALLVGIIVTVVAAYIPARRASKVAPIAAMRDDQMEPEEQVNRRSYIGFGLLGLGAVIIVVQLMTEGSIWLLVAGMLIALIGVIAATPMIARPIARLIGRLTKRRGVVSTLAADNTLRNPRRTAATASALMIGLTLVSMMTVFGASASKSVDSQINEQFKGDYIVGGLPGEELSPEIYKKMSAVEGVEAISRLRMAGGEANGTATMVTGVDPATFARANEVKLASGTTALKDGDALVAKSSAKVYHLKVGDSITLSVDTIHKKRVKIVGVLDELNDAISANQDGFTVPIATFDALGGPNRDKQLTVIKKPGASEAAVQTKLKDTVKDLPTITVNNQAEFAADRRGPIDQMLMLIYGLLGLAIIIAALGIVNTLALSIFERTRENGLLRAVGLSRKQLRQMVRMEAITITMVGAITGVVLGVLFGVAFCRSQADNGITELAFPIGRLVLFLVIAAVIGVLAAWWPARRASKLNVLDAIATE